MTVAKTHKIDPVKDKRHFTVAGTWSKQAILNALSDALW